MFLSRRFGRLAAALMILAPCAFCAVEAAAQGDAEPEIPTVFVQGGCFRMGDASGAGGVDEKPSHEVCVSSFSLGKYPVTQSQWLRVMGNNPSQYPGAGDQPVENVSWNDAQSFIRELRQRTGKKWRLPTEAEWEYAAAGGAKKQKYPGTGNADEVGEYAWMDSNSGLKTHPVGLKKPNGLGIYDMAGNVWQWVQDRYDRDYYRQSPRDNPKGDPFGVNRVIRGGSACQPAGFLRVSYRDYQAPENHGNCVGLRLALPAD